MKKVETISTLSELFDAIEYAQGMLNDSGFNLWWRGECRLHADWKLIPSAFRKYPNVGAEQVAMKRFMSKAGSRAGKVPALKDYSSWIFLMQHYGLPTRLLDWSESALVALYFAVSSKDHRSEPGSLTVINPRELNGRIIEGKRAVSPDYVEVQHILAEAFEGKKPPGNCIDNSQRVIAIVPDEFDLRMLAQQTMFTIHTTFRCLTEFDSANDFYLRFSIPAEAKQKMYEDLFKAGIRQSALFPDLTNLAEEIRKTQLH